MENMRDAWRLQWSVKGWNAWRKEHPTITPDLRMANLNWLDLKSADLSGALLHHASLIGADLEGANLKGAELHGVNLQGALLGDVAREGVDWSVVKMDYDDDCYPNWKHLEMLKRGVETWNRWREEEKISAPDLRFANLIGWELQGANLCNADLYRADLRRAHLDHADLRGANLKKANLWQADLTEAEFFRANLENANLSGCSASGVSMSWAILRNSNLRGISGTERTKFGDAEMVNANMVSARLDKADFGRARLNYANLTNASLREATLQDTTLFNATLERADLSGANLSRCLMTGTSLKNAYLDNCEVYGVAVWDVDLEGAQQSDLLITKKGESPIRVDDLEMAQFIHQLLSREKLRNVITTMGQKAVLILGRFAERKELLERIATKLRELEYLPLIFDFERPTDRDLTETIKILAGLSRFVIADITNPQSVALELEATAPDYMVPFVIIRQSKQPAFGMFDGLRKYHWVLKPKVYENVDELLENFQEAIVIPALEKFEEVRRQKAELSGDASRAE